MVQPIRRRFRAVRRARDDDARALLRFARYPQRWVMSQASDDVMDAMTQSFPSGSVSISDQVTNNADQELSRFPTLYPRRRSQ